MDLKQDRTTAFGFILGLLSFAAVAVLGQWSTNALLTASKWVDHTQRVLLAVSDTHAAVAELEATKRAYVVTGNEGSARRFAAVSRALAEHVGELRALTQDNESQQQRLERLEPLLEARRRDLAAEIQARRASGFDLEREAKAVSAGELAGAELRRRLDAMAREELVLLDQREGRTERAVGIARTVQAAGTLVGVALLVLAFVRVGREMRRRRESEHSLRESEARLATTLGSIGDGVIATDAEGRITRMNRVAEALTRWNSSDARGRPITEVFRISDERTGEPVRCPIEQALSEREIVRLSNHALLHAKDGTDVPVADSAAPIEDDDGGLVGGVLVFRDAGAERSWRRKLSEVNAFLDSIVESTPSIVLVKSADSLRYVRVNRAAEAFLGRAREEIVGKTDAELFEKERASAIAADDRAALQGTAPQEVTEERVAGASGDRTLQTRRVPIHGEDGAPRFLLSVCDDVTQQKMLSDALLRLNESLERSVEQRTEDVQKAYQELRHEVAERQRASEALERSQRQLEQAQKMEAVGKLAGGVAHDFNNLLSVILSYSSLLLDELPSDATGRSDIEQIQKAGSRAADLTRQLLAFSRQQVLAPRVMRLSTVIEGMADMLRRVIGEDIELRVVHSDRSGHVLVDPSQMEQVIMNLAVNARDAMPRGGTLTLETSRATLDDSHATVQLGLPPGPYCVLSVTDTGHGMDGETQARIFEPFFTTKEVGKGTGLGLSTVFGIVRQSGGNISVYSEPGSGTVFKVYFPKVEADGEETEAPAPTATNGGSETLLLVEDMDEVRAATRVVLTKAGYQVLEAASGDEALLLCRRFSGTIHLVITDVVMPKMSGRELVEQLSSLRPDTKVLFVSGYTDDTIVHHGVLEQGVAFLQKPLTPGALRAKVREVLDGAA